MKFSIFGENRVFGLFEARSIPTLLDCDQFGDLCCHHADRRPIHDGLDGASVAVSLRTQRLYLKVLGEAGRSPKRRDRTHRVVVGVGKSEFSGQGLVPTLVMMRERGGSLLIA